MGVYFTHKKGRTVLNLVLLSTLMILIGYSSYASVTIRAAANPPMNSNNPSNPFALYSLLNRDQYGDKPLLYGPQFSAPTSGYKYKDVRYLDDDNQKIGYKIRAAQQVDRVPYMLVLGAKEAEAGNLSVRDRKGETTTMEVDEFIAKVTEEIKTRAYNN